jgi:chromosome segregation ATPase
VLVTEQKKISEQQRENKKSRSAQREKYNAAEGQLKSMIADQKDAKGRIGFKTVGEIDAKIKDLTKQVDSGTMRLVDEKKALSEISSLTRQRKGFAGFEDVQKKIDAKKAENVELKKAFDDPEARALDERYDAIRKELDEMNAARDDDRKNFTSLKEERDRLHSEQQESYQKIKEIKDAYFQGRKAHKAYEDELYQQRRDRQKAERDSYEKEKRKRVAEQKLEEASQPAYLDEIITTEGLIRYFDPSSVVSDSKKEPGKFAASAQRSVDDSAIKGMKVVKKEEEDFFVGGGGKKKGKGKKTAPEATKFNMSIGIIEELGKVGVEPPSNQSEVPSVVEKLKSKLETWKNDQDKQTKQVSIAQHSPIRTLNPPKF